MKAIKHPLMYKGFIIKIRNNKTTNNEPKLFAYNYTTDIFLNPIYKKWDVLKKTIDNIKTLN